MTPRGTRSTVARYLALASFVILVAAQALDSWMREAPWVIWTLRLLPLLVFVPGLIQDRVRTYVWLCFVSLMFFITLVERLFRDASDPVAWVAMLAVVTFFCAAMMYTRWRSQELQETDTDAPAVKD